MLREHLSKIVIVALLALIVGVPFLLRPAASGGAAPAGAERLIIYTPHNEQIRYEIGRGFNLWRVKEGLNPIEFDWRSSGGTSDLRKQILAQYEAAAKKGIEDRGIGADLMFGGGDYEHNQLLRGVTVPLAERKGVTQLGRVAIDRRLPPSASVTLEVRLRGLMAGGVTGEALVGSAGQGAVLAIASEVAKAEMDGIAAQVSVTPDRERPSEADLQVTLRNTTGSPVTFEAIEPRLSSRFTDADWVMRLNLSASVPLDLPPGLLEEAYPEPTIGGERLYHPDRYWVGVVLSSFGIVYNRDVLAMLQLPEPETWADLTDPRYAGWVALADPAHSGSIAQTYNVILRRSGWTEGWALLRRIFANARYFTSSASKVPVDVSAGEAAAGMAIDFYGRFQAGAIGGDRVGYADPPGMTAITADPISLLRGAPHEELAEQFVAWLLSVESQRVWQRTIGDGEGHPERFELRRQPIRRDLYTPDEQAYWVDRDLAPFDEAAPFPQGMPNFYGMVAPIAHAMAIDVHEELVAAWKAIQATPADHPKRAEMLALFDAMPPELALQWPSEALREAWPRALADEGHPLHDEAAAALGAFNDSFRVRYVDRDQLLRDRVAWSLFFRNNYRRVIELAGE